MNSLSTIVLSSTQKPGVIQAGDIISPTLLEELSISENTTVGQLPSTEFQVNEHEITSVVDEAFRQIPDLSAVVVKKDDGVVGIISRRKFYEMLGKRYGVAIYLKHPIQLLLENLETKPLLIPASNLIADTVQQALDRSADQIYDPLLIEVGADRFRILDIYTLLLAQSRLFANLQRQLQQINQELEHRVAARTAELLDANTQLEQEVKERVRAEVKLEIRLRYEKTLTLCANTLLVGGDTEGVITSTLHYLIDAVGVSRVFLWENVDLGDSNPGFELRSQVRIADVPPLTTEMDVLPFSLLGSWRNRLWQGEHIIGHIGDLSGRDKRLMKKLDFSSVLLLPIGEPGNWAGVIGFGEIVQMREWEDNDIKLLRTVAQMIYAYLERVRNARVVAEARDEALKASQFKSELLAKVSHELRTPLGAIMGYAQLLSFGSYGNLTDDQGEATNLIIGSSKYLASLVNGILDQAQLESGQLTLVHLLYNVRNLVNDVESIIRVLAEDKGLKFEVVISPEIPEEQRGDQTRLQQVLTNLLGNSVKFTERGTISLYVYLCLRKICFEITDTGIGIPMEAQSKIFESFTQVDGSTTRRTSGTGLGLSISKQLVEMMNGQIKLTSRVGIGSTFIVELPRTELSNESHPKNDTTARIQYGKRSGIDCRR